MWPLSWPYIFSGIRYNSLASWSTKSIYFSVRPLFFKTSDYSQCLVQGFFHPQLQCWNTVRDAAAECCSSTGASFLGKIKQYITDSDQLKQIPKSAEKSRGMRTAKNSKGLGCHDFQGIVQEQVLPWQQTGSVEWATGVQGLGTPPIQPQYTPFSKAKKLLEATSCVSIWIARH